MITQHGRLPVSGISNVWQKKGENLPCDAGNERVNLRPGRSDIESVYIMS